MDRAGPYGDLGISPIEGVGSWAVLRSGSEDVVAGLPDPPLQHLNGPPTPPLPAHSPAPKKPSGLSFISTCAPAGMRVMSRSNRPFPVPLPCPLRPPGPAPRPCRVLKTPFLRKPGFRTKTEESGAPSSWLRSAHNTCPSHPVETAGPRAAQPRAQSDGAF